MNHLRRMKAYAVLHIFGLLIHDHVQKKKNNRSIIIRKVTLHACKANSNANSCLVNAASQSSWKGLNHADHELSHSFRLCNVKNVENSSKKPINENVQILPRMQFFPPHRSLQRHRGLSAPQQR